MYVPGCPSVYLYIFIEMLETRSFIANGILDMNITDFNIYNL